MSFKYKKKKFINFSLVFVCPREDLKLEPHNSIFAAVLATKSREQSHQTTDSFANNKTRIRPEGYKKGNKKVEVTSGEIVGLGTSSE